MYCPSKCLFVHQYSLWWKWPGPKKLRQTVVSVSDKTIVWPQFPCFYVWFYSVCLGFSPEEYFVRIFCYSPVSAPWIAGLRNKIPACWAKNIQIFLHSRQRMSRGVSAFGLKKGLSLRTRSLHPRKHNLWGCEPPGTLCGWASICPIIPLHTPTFSPFHWPLFLSPGGPTSNPLHAWISAFLKWDNLLDAFPFL